MASLNDEYCSYINNDLPIDEAYEKMVVSRPRRFLSKHDYNNNGAPLRSARCTVEPKDTDVSSIFQYLTFKSDRDKLLLLFFVLPMIPFLLTIYEVSTAMG